MSTMHSRSQHVPVRGSSPQIARAELRYRVPVMAIEPDGDEFACQDWSKLGFILSDLKLGEIGGAGTRFSGSFTIGNFPGFGLFDATIERIDCAYGTIVVRFAEISAFGLSLLEMAEQQRHRTAAARSPVLTIKLAYPTYDWSLSGLAISEGHGRFQCGQQIRGNIRVDRTQAVFAFCGLVLRVSHDAEIVAIRLLQLGAGARALLQATLQGDRVTPADDMSLASGAA